MSNGFTDKDGKFHPITTYKGVRKSRSQKAKQQGVKIKPRKQRVVAKIPQPDGTETVLKMENENFDEVTDPVERQQILDMLSKSEIEEWEGVVNSEIVKVKHEMLNGMPITTLRFANGEEWFEFESFDHQEKYVKKEKINVDENVTGEFVEIDHPDIAGYITMESGSILFGERENKRLKRDRSEVEAEVIKDLDSNPYIEKGSKRYEEMFEEQVAIGMGKPRAVHSDFVRNPNLPSVSGKGRLECRHCGKLTSDEFSDLGCNCQLEGNDEDDE